MRLLNPWIIVGILVFIALSGFQGYRLGIKACEAKHAAALVKSIEENKRLNAERLEALEQREELARQLEVEANAEPVVVSQCLSPSRVRRLNNLQ